MKNQYYDQVMRDLGHKLDTKVLAWKVVYNRLESGIQYGFIRTERALTPLEKITFQDFFNPSQDDHLILKQQGTALIFWDDRIAYPKFDKNNPSRIQFFYV